MDLLLLVDLLLLDFLPPPPTGTGSSVRGGRGAAYGGSVRGGRGAAYGGSVRRDRGAGSGATTVSLLKMFLLSPPPRCFLESERLFFM